MPCHLHTGHARTGLLSLAVAFAVARVVAVSFQRVTRGGRVQTNASPFSNNNCEKQLFETFVFENPRYLQMRRRRRALAPLSFPVKGVLW